MISRSHTPLAYDDSATLAEMHSDCRATGAHLGLERAARRAVRSAPSLHFDEQPRDTPKRVIEISEATAALAAAIYEG